MLKSFDEMMWTGDGRLTLRKILDSTPELVAKERQLTELDRSFFRAFQKIIAIGDFDYDEISAETFNEVSDALVELRDATIDIDIFCELVEMARRPIFYEAYKIWCERAKGG